LPLPCSTQAILDFCAQPGFAHEAYLNLDCRIERGNLFEGICALLSKTAFPVNSGLAAVHLLSLDGLFSILSALAARCAFVF
jgi:brefeldin A-resistance guanine nucleotide exchange factor 1